MKQPLDEAEDLTGQNEARNGPYAHFGQVDLTSRINRGS